MKKPLPYIFAVFVILFVVLCTSGRHASSPYREKIRTDIVIGVSSDIVSPDPHNQNDAASGRVLHMIYDTLVTLDKDGKSFKPSLAELWETPSSTEYIFKLRRDVVFHNGERFDAHDAKFTIERCMESPKTAQFTECIQDVIILDDYTVKIVTKYPFAPFLYNISSPALSILDEATTISAGDNFRKNPIGTGPMVFLSWSPNNQMKLKRNNNYWAFLPVSTSITFQIIPESLSRTIALEMGEVDFLDSVDPPDARAVMSNPDLKTFTQMQGSVTYLGMNYAAPPFDNSNVRKAIAHAIKREHIIEASLEGFGIVSDTIFPPMMPSFDGSLNLYPYDAEKSRLLLAQAGYSDGLYTEIAVSGDERNRIAQLLQSDLSEVGVHADIIMLEWGAFLDYVSGKSHRMFILSWSNAYNPDGTLFDVFHSSRPTTTNRCNYKNESVSLKIELARSERDPAARDILYRELQYEIMSEPVWIPLFVKTSVIAMNKNMEGVELLPVTEYTYVNAYVKE